MRSVFAMLACAFALGLLGCMKGDATPTIATPPAGTGTSSGTTTASTGTSDAVEAAKAAIDPETGTAAIPSNPAAGARTKWSYDQPSKVVPGTNDKGAYVKQADGTWHMVAEGIDPFPYEETASTSEYIELKSLAGDFVVRLYADHADSRPADGTEFKQMAVGSW